MSPSKVLKRFAMSLACAASLGSVAASATPITNGTVYSYNLTNTSNLGSGTLATVTLTQSSGTEVDVKVELASGGYFVGTGVGPTFDFSLLSAYSKSLVTLTGNNTSSFTVNPYLAQSGTAYNLSPDGMFTNSISLNSPGNSAKVGGPLTFSVINQAGIWLDDFTTSAKKNNGQLGGNEFGVDMFFNGNTGSAAFHGTTPTTVTKGPSDSGPGPTEVPEPASLALMGMGLLGVGLLRKRNKA